MGGVKNKLGGQLPPRASTAICLGTSGRRYHGALPRRSLYSDPVLDQLLDAQPMKTNKTTNSATCVCKNSSYDSLQQIVRLLTPVRCSFIAVVALSLLANKRVNQAFTFEGLLRRSCSNRARAKNFSCGRLVLMN